jgi:hypothetical protein
MNSSYTFILIHYSIILPLTSGYPKLSIPLRFSHWMLFTFVTFLVRAACLTRFTLLILSRCFYPMGSKHHDACHAVFFPSSCYVPSCRWKYSPGNPQPLRDLRFPLPCCLHLLGTNLIMETAITSVSNFTNPHGVIFLETESPSLSHILSSSLETFVLHFKY